MFSLSALVGTPLALSRLEFTPIGKRKPGTRKDNPSEGQKIGLNTEKINNTYFDSTFEDTTDKFDSLHSIGNDHITESVPVRSDKKSAGMFDNMFKRNIVSGESSSIQLLQDENRSLKGENYNLKIEVATLTKFLKQTPQEHRDLAYENVELKQQLVKALEELETAGAREVLLASRDTEKVARNDSEIDDLRSRYRGMIEERDQEIDSLRQKIAELSHSEKTPNIPNDILDQMAHLRDENQKLRRQSEESSVHLMSATDLQKENNDLKMQLRDLHSKYAGVPSDSASQLDHLSTDNDLLRRKLEALDRDYKETERERDSLDSTLRSLRLQFADKAAEVERLSREQNSRSRTSIDVSSKLDAAEHELAGLKQKLSRDATRHLEELDDKKTEISRLALRLDALTKELKEEDKENFNLRAQIRSLMEERTDAFDNKATIEHYQTQLKSLREKERTLLEENRRLKDEAAKLQDELFDVKTASNRLHKLSDEVQELQDKLDFYEKEYGLLQDALENAELEAEDLKTKHKKLEDQIFTLDTEAEQLRQKLRRSELAESQKYNESALFELEELHRNREDSGKRRLQQQVDALNLQVHRLQDELSDAKSINPSALNSELHKLMSDRSRLQIELDDKELKLQEHHKRYSKLEAVVKDKETVIEALESRVRDFNNQYKSSLLSDDINQSEIKRIRLDYEHQIRAFKEESERLQRDLEDEIRYYKTRLEVFTERQNHQLSSNSASLSLVSLLESQLDEARQMNGELTRKLDLAERENRTISEDREKLRDLQLRYEKVADEKVRLQEIIDDLETDSKLLRSEKNRLDARAKNLSAELSRTSRHCTKLATKISEMDANDYKNSYKNVEDVLRAKKTNVQLQNQIELLNAKLAAADLYPKNLDTAEMRLLKNELLYYKAKLFELNLRSNDLAMINSYIKSSMNSSNRVIKDDIVKLAQSGIYPSYDAASYRRDGRKLTMKTLATFVLSMVRLRRRKERADLRNSKLEQLRGEIDRDKITILAERA